MKEKTVSLLAASDSDEVLLAHGCPRGRSQNAAWCVCGESPACSARSLHRARVLSPARADLVAGGRLGFIKKQLSSDEKAGPLEMIAAYRSSLVVALILIEHYVRKAGCRFGPAMP